MADHKFNINLGIEVQKGNSQKQLNNIKKKLEEKKIQLKLDTSKLNSELKTFKKSLTGLNKQLNDAFKLNKGQLQNLQDLKNVLSEINKLSKKTKIQITDSKDGDTVTKNLENQKKKYLELLKLRQSLQKQMAKTTNATSYSNLKSELEMVTQEAEKCKTKISELSKIKLKADMTKSMTSQFQSLQKQAKSLKTNLENSLKNTNLTSTQKQQLQDMLSTINKISQTRIGLKTADAEPKLQSMLKELETINGKYKNIKINIKATSNIDKTTKKVNIFLGKLKMAQNEKIGANSFLNEKELNKVISKVENLKQQLKSINMSDNVGTETTKIVKELENAKSKFKELQNVAKLDMKLNGNVSSLNKQIDTMVSKLNQMKNNKLGSNAYIDESKITKMINDLEKYKQLASSLDINDEKVVAEFENIRNSVDKVNTEMKELNAEGKLKMTTEGNSTQIEALRLRIEKLRQTEKITAEQAQILKQKLEDIKKVDVGKQTNEMKKLKNQITQAVNETAKLNSGVKKTGTFFNNLYSSMSTFSLGNIISTQITKAVYSISDTIKELDKAFVEFNKVAPDSFHGTEAEFDSLREKAISVGQEVARSSIDIINSTASALQLGIDDIDRALEYAKNVNMYANVADISESEADTYIKSIMSAYGGVNESLDEMAVKVKGAGEGYSMLTNYMDMANYAGNNFALTSADVGEALERSASSLKSADVELSEGIGMIISAQEVTQDASKVG